MLGHCRFHVRQLDHLASLITAVGRLVQSRPAVAAALGAVIDYLVRVLRELERRPLRARLLALAPLRRSSSLRAPLFLLGLPFPLGDRIVRRRQARVPRVLPRRRSSSATRDSNCSIFPACALMVAAWAATSSASSSYKGAPARSSSTYKVQHFQGQNASTRDLQTRWSRACSQHFPTGHTLAVLNTYV